MTSCSRSGASFEFRCVCAARVAGRARSPTRGVACSSLNRSLQVWEVPDASQQQQQQQQPTYHLSLCSLEESPRPTGMVNWLTGCKVEDPGFITGLPPPTRPGAQNEQGWGKGVSIIQRDTPCPITTSNITSFNLYNASY